MVVWDFAAQREDLHQTGLSNAGKGLDVIQSIDAAIAILFGRLLGVFGRFLFSLAEREVGGFLRCELDIELHRGRLIHMSYYFGGVPWTGYPNRALTVSQFLWSAATLVSSGD